VVVEPARHGGRHGHGHEGSDGNSETHLGDVMM
jgi:hypothetical protein